MTSNVIVLANPQLEITFLNTVGGVFAVAVVFF